MANLVSDARRVAYGSMSEQMNFLAADAAAGATELAMTMDVAGITPGMTISSGLNVWYVTGSISAERKVLVYPGLEGSPSAPVAAGSPVLIKPRVTDWYVFGALNDAIRAMSSPTNGLYAEGVFSHDTYARWATYDIPFEAYDMLGIIRVRVNSVGGTGPLPYFDLPPYMIEWQPENQTIRLKRDVPIGSTIEFVVKLPLVPADALTDDVMTKCGLSESMTDIPPLGAAVALLRTTESRRNQISAQGDARRATEVGAGSNSSIARELERDFKSRIADEYVRLINRNPIFRGI